MSTIDIVAKQVRQLQKDRDEQARSESSRVMQFDFRVVLSTEASVMRVVNFLAAHHSSYGSKRLRTALQFFTILHTLDAYSHTFLAKLQTSRGHRKLRTVQSTSGCCCNQVHTLFDLRSYAHWGSCATWPTF